MDRARLRLPVLLPVLLPLAAACGAEGTSGSPGDGGVPGATPEPSSVVLQAVDAGTGGALSDSLLTVRHLVRAPVTLDATAVERVSPLRPHRIGHPVSGDSLVLELRLEAASYHRVDTVLAVARGASAGPVTLRMTRRLESGRAGGAEGGAAGTSFAGPAGAAAGTAASGASGVAPDHTDRTPLEEGDRAFRDGAWAAATNAYRRMPPPTPGSAYAGEYREALVRLGRSHIRLGEWGGALDALLEAKERGAPGHEADFYLGQAECAVGRVDDGLRSLAEVERMAPRVPAADRPALLALLDYQRAVCDQHHVDVAREPGALLRAGTASIRAYQAFIERGEALRPATPEVTAAVEDARRRVEEIRLRLQTGGGGGSGASR